MEKREKKSFWKEFREFISRGNVFDLAVGVIIGGAFSVIVTALCDNVLKPIINWILALITGSDSMEDIYTFLVTGYDETGAVDLTQLIYIDWAAFLNAVINFLLIAFVLFLIVKALMRVKTAGKHARENVVAIAQKYKEEKAGSSDEKSEDSEKGTDSDKS